MGTREGVFYGTIMPRGSACRNSVCRNSDLYPANCIMLISTPTVYTFFSHFSTKVQRKGSHICTTQLQNNKFCHSFVVIF